MCITESATARWRSERVQQENLKFKYRLSRSVFEEGPIFEPEIAFSDLSVFRAWSDESLY